MAKRISIINFKGGVGKTTLAFQLATGLVRFHAPVRVLVVDMDHQSSLSIVCLGPRQWNAAVASNQTVNEIFRPFIGQSQNMPGQTIISGTQLSSRYYSNLRIVPASLQLDDIEIELTASHHGNAIQSEWDKRTLVCRWLEESDADGQYDYIIFDCPPATKIVSQNAIAASHGYIIPVIPEAVMERGAPHLFEMVRSGIDTRLKALAGNYILDVESGSCHIGRIKRKRPMFDLTNPIFTSADKARDHLESINWPEGPFCPHCGETENVHRLQGKSHRAGLIQCNSCLKNFTVTVGTVFERSKIGLHKWMLATYLLASSKKGMSAHQLHRMLGVTYKTAWFMAHRIREAMDGAAPTAPLGGKGSTVEVDETYVGGKARNRATRKPAPKKAVVALVERDGHARSFHVANVNAATLRPPVVVNVDRGSHLMTDDALVYTGMGREFSGHSVVNHSAKEYVTTGGFKHSNTAENFFSIFKRGVIGTYHHMSEAHLGRYCAEFDLRYNTRKLSDGERASAILKGGVGRRLTYRRIDRLAA